MLSLPVYWTRFEMTKEDREWTHRRILAAKRAVQREADAMPLFPELRRFSTVEERQEQMDQRARRIVAHLRLQRARAWRRARQLLRELSEYDREKVLLKWNTRYTPGTPQNLIATMQMCLGPSMTRRVHELCGLIPAERIDSILEQL